jgi:dolichol-phosphate mannosyltransferase
MLTKDGISLIIPAYNEARTISLIINRCAKISAVKQIVVINDGSKDDTKKVLSKILKSWKKTSKLLITHHKKNLGKGAAIETGLKRVTGKYVMVQDADLEYFPEEITKLFNKAQKSKDGIVFGTRSHNKKKGYILAQLGNLYLETMFNLLYNYSLTDSYTCYKLLPKKIWLELNLKTKGFEIDAELISKLGTKGYKIEEVPISYNPRNFSDGKKIGWPDLIKATIVAFKIRLGKF